MFYLSYINFNVCVWPHSHINTIVECIYKHRGIKPTKDKSKVEISNIFPEVICEANLFEPVHKHCNQTEATK